MLLLRVDPSAERPRVAVVLFIYQKKADAPDLSYSIRLGGNPFKMTRRSMIRKILLMILLSGLLSTLGAQVGGDNTYEFLNLNASARIAGLGGSLISVRDDDASLAYHNPALLNASMHRQLAFSHAFHLAGINYGYASYAHHARKADITWHGGVQYASYGNFDERDEFGNQLGTFKAAEYALTFGAARQVDERLTLGANAKVISSQLAGFNSFGLSLDLGALYFDTSRQISVGIIFKNIGTQLSTYDGNDREPLPFEIQMGISKRLRYLPFRFSIIYHHMQRWNILYDDPNAEQPSLFFGDVQTGRSDTEVFFDNFFRHFIFNGELLIGQKDNLRLRLGYNHLLRKELSVANFSSFAGFSFGFGLKINRFRIDYGRTAFHLAGGMNQFTISTSLREFGIE